MRHPSSLFLVIPLALTIGATAQDRKVPTTLPYVDLDNKPCEPAAPVTATSPKVDTPSDMRGITQRQEPLKGTERVTLPNGTMFRAGLPRDQVLFDDVGPIWAEGGNYKASFSASGFTFVPYFGAEAPENYPLTITLESAQFGAAVTPLAVRSPRRQGNTVTIDRGAVVERYDLTVDDVEQKFVIASPFAGDLALTLRVQTDLAAGRDAAGLRFGNTLGHVGYTNAELVDALGRRLPMQTDLVNGKIRLRAPAAMIAGAAFPVTVDPVIVNFAATSNTTHVLTNVDLAYSGACRQYLVVWTRIFSATDTDLHAVSIDRTGTVVPGSSSLIDNSGDRWDDGRVAKCSGSFLAVASRQPQAGGTRAIWGRVRGICSPYTMGAQFQISSTETGDKVRPDVGGEFSAAQRFCVVWQRNFTAADHDIHYRMVTAQGAVSGAVGFIDNSGTNDDYRPRIAKSNGGEPTPLQVWPIVWQRQIGGTQHDIYGARVLYNGTLATPPFAIDNAAGDDDTEPTVSSFTGTGRAFLVAYTTNSPGNLDIYLRAYQDGATPTVIGSAYLAALENLGAAARTRDQFQAQTDSDDCRFAVSYLERYSVTDRDAYVTTLHLTPNLVAVDPRVTLTFSSLDTHSASLVANRSGGLRGPTYGTAFDQNSASGPVTSSIDGAIYDGVTAGGGFATRATACGGFRLSFPNGDIPAPGNTISFDLHGALGPSIFSVGAPAPALSLCAPAPCALGTTPTVILGGPTWNLYIPCRADLVGATLAVQGVALASPGGCSGFGQIVTSDTVDMTIR